MQPRFSEVSKSDFVAGFFCQSDKSCAVTLGIFDDGAKINPGIGIPCTKTVKEALLQSFHNQDGVEFWDKLAKQDLRLYAQCLTRLIPAEVNAEIYTRQKLATSEIRTCSRSSFQSDLLWFLPMGLNREDCC